MKWTSDMDFLRPIVPRQQVLCWLRKTTWDHPCSSIKTRQHNSTNEIISN